MVVVVVAEVMLAVLVLVVLDSVTQTTQAPAYTRPPRLTAHPFIHTTSTVSCPSATATATLVLVLVPVRVLVLTLVLKLLLLHTTSTTS